MKKISKLKIYLSIVSILLAWFALTNLILIGKYNILPLKYLLILSLFILGLPIVLIVFMLRKKTKPKIKIGLSIISIIFIILFGILLFYLNKTFNFLNNLNSNNYKIENYSVVVLKNSNYENIDDLNDKNIGYIESDTSHIDEALVKLDDVISIDKIKKDNYDELIEELYSENVDSIIIEEAYRGIIEETLENFSEETKILYTIEIEIETEDIVKDVDVKSEAFNIYISGIDTYGSISSVSRSDVNIIATINPTTHQILLTTIPRDYYVQLDGTTGYKDKLTHAGIYGIDKSIKTLENLLDIEINYYIKVNFSSVEKLVDTLGGVDVYSQYTFIGTGGTSFTSGYNRVNGKQALEFARTRKTIDGGDRTRGQNQQALISAMIDKACSKEILTKYTSILNSLEGSFETNMPTNKITDLIKKQIDDMKSWNVTSISLDGSNGSEYTYSYPHQKLYVMIPDENTITNAKEKIKAVVGNQTLEASYIKNNGNVSTPTKEQTTQVETKQEEIVPIQEEKKETTQQEEKKETTTIKEETTTQQEEKKETTTIEEETIIEQEESPAIDNQPEPSDTPIDETENDGEPITEIDE